MRTALLAAVSHDLRSPLASAKAAVTSLRSDRSSGPTRSAAELLATADESLDRLTRLIENLLDMSRLQAGALAVTPRPGRARRARAPRARRPRARAAHDVGRRRPRDPARGASPTPCCSSASWPTCSPTPCGYSPAGRPPLRRGQRARRPRRAPRRRPRARRAPRTGSGCSRPFQRLGDRDNTTGVGLGLALSRGLTEAMGGTLTAEDTPGGGLTMTVSLPAAVARASAVLDEATAAARRPVGTP